MRENSRNNPEVVVLGDWKDGVTVNGKREGC